MMGVDTMNVTGDMTLAESMKPSPLEPDGWALRCLDGPRGITAAHLTGRHGIAIVGGVRWIYSRRGRLVNWYRRMFVDLAGEQLLLPFPNPEPAATETAFPRRAEG